MLTLTPTLESAIRRGTREPTIRAVVTDQPCERARWAWSAIYGPADEDGAHGIAQMLSGPLVRARQTSAGAVVVQKIADPTQTGQWTGWTTLKAAGTTHTDAGLALTASTVEDRLRIFYADAADGRTIRCAESTDGVAWTETLVYAEPSPRQVRALAADMSAGDGHLVYVVDLAAGAPDEVLVAVEKVGGVWTNRVQQGLSRYPTAGIAVARDPATSTLSVVVADGEGSGGAERRMALQEFDGATNTWGTQSTVLKHGAGSGFDVRRPRLRLATATFPRHLFTWVEVSSGSPAYNRPMIGTTPQRTFLTEWVPWEAESSYGLALLRAQSGDWYLVGAQRAYRAPGYTGGSGQRLDVSTDVLEVRLETSALHRPTRGRLLLANGSGRYDTAGLSGAALCLREGAQVGLRLGFRTSTGDEGLWQPPLWIETIAHGHDGREATVEVELTDCWGLLERLRPSITIQFPSATTLGYVLDRALWRVTAVSTSGPAGLASAISNAVWPPGRSYAEIAAGLCRLAGAFVRFRTLQSAPDGAGFSSVQTDARETGSQVATYGYGTAHPITAYRLATGGQPCGHVTVEGARAGPYRAEAHDYPAISLLWRRLTRAFTDLRLNSQADTQRTADALLREARQGARGGWIEAPLNPAQEMGDTIAVTAPRAGLAGTPHLVVGMRLHWSRRPTRRADMRLELGAP